MKNSNKKAKAAALVIADTVQQQLSISNSCQSLSDDSCSMYQCLSFISFFVFFFFFCDISIH